MNLFFSLVTWFRLMEILIFVESCRSARQSKNISQFHMDFEIQSYDFI